MRISLCGNTRLFLDDVRKEREVGTTGVDGGRLVTSEIGHLPGFFDVSCSERAVANILSLSEVEDRFDRVESVLPCVRDIFLLYRVQAKIWCLHWQST